MIRLKFIAFSLLILLVQSLPTAHAAQEPLHSAARAPGEPAAHAYQRYLQRLHARVRHPRDGVEEDVAATPVGTAAPFEQIDFSKAPLWPSDMASLQAAFERARDHRFMQSPDRQNFLRRPSWLYPDDGCFARAALFVQDLSSRSEPRPGKFFAFGNLTVKTPNSPTGSVSWWYHVVPIFRTNQGVWVMDPAIEPKHPMSAKDWFAAMSPQPSTIKGAVCDSYSYGPYSACQIQDPRNPSDSGALNDQKTYLSAEWKRLEALKRDPVKELGDLPPWKTQQQRPRIYSSDAAQLASE